MSIKTELWGLGISGTLCWIGFILTLVGSNPGTGSAALASFYISLFIGILTTVTLAGYLIRRYLTRGEAKYVAMRTAFRQAILVSALLVALLMMQAARLLSWWDVLLFVIVVSLFELYIRSYGRSQHI
jgi:hypothetical protein